jgi:hypothetical protein
MTRILLSLFTIGVVMALATTATLAFFQGTATFSNDPSTLTTVGDVSFVAVLTTDNGTPTPFTATLQPGQTLNRCLWLRNTGGVPARIKVYMKPGSELGSTALGDALRINAKLTPDAGRCTDNPASISGSVGQFTNFSTTGWLGSLVRGGGFYTIGTTPFLSNATGDAFGANQYARFQFDLELPSTAGSELANKSYTFQGELFAEQDGGTLTATPTPTSTPVPTDTPEPTAP